MYRAAKTNAVLMAGGSRVRGFLPECVLRRGAIRLWPAILLDAGFLRGSRVFFFASAKAG